MVTLDKSYKKRGYHLHGFSRGKPKAFEPSGKFDEGKAHDRGVVPGVIFNLFKEGDAGLFNAIGAGAKEGIILLNIGTKGGFIETFHGKGGGVGPVKGLGIGLKAYGCNQVVSFPCKGEKLFQGLLSIKGFAQGTAVLSGPLGRSR